MITYDYYRIFYYVGVYKSFTKAAQVLHNNQPNITRSMNNLEQELQCKLFLRSNKGVELTKEGHQLWEHIAIAYEQITLGEEEIRKKRELENGLVTIGASEIALRLFLLKKLEAFHENYPNVRIRISNHSTPQAIAALNASVVDFAVVTTPLSIHAPLKQASLHSFSEVLIAGSKYKNLAAKKRSLKEIIKYPIITLNEGTGTRTIHSRYFLSENLPFKPDMEVATTDQILPMVTHNLGLGFYPEELAKEAILHQGIAEIPLMEQLPQREVCLLWNSRLPQSAAVRKMMEFLS